MSEFKQLTGTEGLKKIGSLIEDIPIAMLVTTGEDGSFESRPMATHIKNFDGTVWFLTPLKSEKVHEIKDDSHATLVFSDAANAKYISAKGRAYVSQDRAKIHELWNSMYKAWFPAGEDDPNIAVLRVDITEADYWEASSSKIVRGIKYLAAAATGGKVDVGEAGKAVIA
ncbi:pyridoxamine 5'-phosphate oxidase family protein [Tunturiibacter gelidoferens]|jgi:general stress protein 26|uniref:General stress protein 26 n=1 Tax=Tunturiibacter gelidiferens TaxID=3069689 RepID=A0A9X0QHZ5_9BACT|nr:pyridoxamine 5'-phosphate oxidase family protein [Edaphobacter lichenicola]MBB5330570.1 general stress protein 26 [Edaphobacter lichenicola]